MVNSVLDWPAGDVRLEGRRLRWCGLEGGQFAWRLRRRIGRPPAGRGSFLKGKKLNLVQTEVFDVQQPQTHHFKAYEKCVRMCYFSSKIKGRKWLLK